MEYVPLGSTDMIVSEISLGAMQINCKPGFKGAEEGDEPMAIRAVQTAVAECGVNFIDTARWYHRSQEMIGKALAELDGGDEVMIATKVSPEPEEAKLLDQFEFCLDALRRDSVDLLQLHSATDPERRDPSLEVIQKLRDEGRCRYLGVTMGYGSRVPEQAMRCIRSGAYDAIQIHVNVLHPIFAREVLPAAKEAGMGTIAMNPQCGGYLAKRCPDPDRYDLSFLEGLGVADLHQAALKWLISLDCLDVAIPGSKRPEHIRANCSVSDGRYMSEEQMRRLEEELAGTIDTTDDWGWEP